MPSKVISLLIILFMCSSSRCGKAEMGISKEEDLELERQLKILNKPPVKTIQKTEEGDIIDCIDIYKQPALDHPLLKNHKIQLQPSSLPASMPKTSSSANSILLRSRREACPIGTVPIRRTRKEDLMRARSLSEEPPIHLGQKARFPGHAVLSVTMKQDVLPYNGATAYVSVYNLSIAPDQVSSTNIWIANGPYDNVNVITSGWTVSQPLYRDNLTRLFTFWTGDGYNKTGCYNTLCPGFVQVDSKITPDYPVVPASTYGGQQYDLKFVINQDPTTGNWWLVVSEDNHKVGYWPKEIFSNLSDGTSHVAWGGIAIAGSSGISPPMGNGHYPDGNYKDACYWRQVNFLSKEGDLGIPSDDGAVAFVDKPGCYNLTNDKYRKDRWLGYSFTFGGPGGPCM